MKNSHPTSISRLSICLVFIALTVPFSGCGLAMDNEDRLERAEAAFAEGDYSAAIIDAKNVLVDEPENTRARLLLGRSSLRVNDGVTAENEFRRAVASGISHASVAVDLAKAMLMQGKFEQVLDENYSADELSSSDQLALKVAQGNAYLGLGQPEKARETFTAVLDSEPDDVDALLGVASSYVSEQNIIQARSVLEHIVQVSPDSTRVRLFSGALNGRIGKFEAAKADYDKALALATAAGNLDEQRKALVGVAESLLSQNKIDEARVAVDELARIAAGAPKTLMLSARVAYADKDWMTAQQNLQQVLSMVGDYPPAQLLLGAVHMENGNLSQAEAYLSAVVANSPDNVRARQMLAQVQLRMRRFDAAQQVLAPMASDLEADSISLQLAAHASMDQQNFDQAIDYLKRSISKQPGNPDLQLQLAAALLGANRLAEADKLINEIDTGGSEDSAYKRDAIKLLSLLRAGDIPSARVAASELIDKWSERASAHNLAGRIFLAERDLDAARQSFETAADLEPNDVSSRRFLALIDERAGDHAAAATRYRNILADTPDADWAMIGLARAAVRNGDKETALGWLEKAVKVAPGSESAAVALASLQIEMKNIDAAETLILRSLESNSASAPLHNLLGSVRFVRKDYQGAIQGFREALALDEGSSDYQINVALAEARLGNATTAMQLLEQQGSKVLDRISSGVMFAALKAGVGEIDAAIKIANELQARHPESSVPVALEAELHALNGDLEKADATYERALGVEETKVNAIRAYQIKQQSSDPNAKEPLLAYLERNPDDTDVRLILAESLGLDENVRESIQEYERVVKANPRNGVALNNLAWAYNVVQDPRAVETARRAYEILPDSGSVADTLGWILVQNGQVEEGAGVLAKAALLSPAKGEIRYHYAVALAKLGRKDEARDELEQALNVGPSLASRDAAEQLLADLR